MAAVTAERTQLSGVSLSPYGPCSDWLRGKKIFSVPYFSMPGDSDAAGQYIEPSQFAALLPSVPTSLRQV